MNENDSPKSCSQIHIIQELLHISKLVLSRLDVALEDAELSEAKFWALKHLIETDDSLGVTQLADCMGSAKSNATQIIDRLEAEGLVQRLPNPDDRRSVLVRVTEEGMTHYQSGIEVRVKAAEAMMCQLDDAERAQLVMFLDTIRNSL